MRRLPLTTAEEVAPAAEVALDVLRDGGVVLLPTETFYGLAVSPHDGGAVDRVIAMKGRPAAMAMPVLCADWAQVESLVQVPARHRPRLEFLWPGALTVVLPWVEPVAAAPGATLAVRIPGHALLRSLLARVGPVTGTSANRHGRAPSSSVAAALESLLAEPDLALDGGTTSGGLASTLVDLSEDAHRVLRRGAVEW